MASSALALAVKDNCSGTLSGGISAAVLSIPLTAGQGASFPQPYNGTCSSLGTAILLNSTGILAIIGSGSAKKMIRNVTDGSIAYIKSIATNAVTTTALTGGTTNVWNNADAWRIDEFVVTLANVTVNTSGSVTSTTVNSYEEALIIARATDTLTVATGGRGYNGTTAQSFLINDQVNLNVTAPIVQGLKDTVFEMASLIDSHTTSLATIRSGSDFYAIATGSGNAYLASYPSIPSPIVAGTRLTFLANFTNTASATLTPTLTGVAQSAYTIKKLDGATNIVSGDTANGEIITVEFDGTNMQLVAPTAVAPATVPTGALMPYPVSIAPSGWLLCYGQAVSRVTYSSLFSTLVRTATATITIAAPVVITWNAHGLATNDQVKFTTTGALPTGLTAGTTYYVLNQTTNTFQLSSTIGGGTITTTGTQSGTHTAIHAPHGDGDGSTTFTIPDFRGRLALGLDNMGGTAAGRVTGETAALSTGKSGGSEVTASHTHSLSQTVTNPGGGSSVVGTNATGSTSPYAMNPFLTLLWIIKI